MTVKKNNGKKQDIDEKNDRGLPPEIIELLTHSDEERIKFILTDRWIDYYNATEILEEMQYLLRQPKRSRMEGMLLIAPSGNGKTELLKRFIRTNVLENGGRYGFVDIPTRATLKAFYSELLFVLGIPNTRSETTGELQHKILQAINQLNIRMLIVDEVHNMFESRRENIKDVLNGLKELSNQSQIPIIFSGIDLAAKTIYIEEQVSKRFPYMELPLWKNDKEYRDFLYTFECLLPLKKPSYLWKLDNATEIFSYSDGLIGDIVKIITRSAEQAIKKGSESITSDLIKRIGERIVAQRKYANAPGTKQ
nr:TniB family NTP-binding protein [Candidatus Sigynarchaeota archaeon]